MIKMKDCDCEEPCEDCKHEEKVDLDSISNVLFGNTVNAKESSGEAEVPEEGSKEEIDEEKVEAEEADEESSEEELEVEEEMSEEVEDKETIEKEVKEDGKKVKAIEGRPSKPQESKILEKSKKEEKKDYKDPITEDYKKEFNNKIGKNIWGKRFGEDQRFDNVPPWH
jgi:hypothetical protein